jgi:hypothetical protein
LVKLVFDGILDIIDRRGEWVLWCQSILNVENYVTSGCSDEPTETIVRAMERQREAGAVKVDQNWIGVLISSTLCRRLVKMGFDSAAIVARRDSQYRVGIGFWRSKEFNEEADKRDENF